MLSRAAHRKHALHRLQRSHKELALPWLCPALLRSQLTTRAQPVRPNTIPKSPTHIPKLQSTRSLATVKPSYYDPHGTHIPFEGLDAYGSPSEPQSLSSPFSSRPPLSDPYDPMNRDASSVVILQNFLTTKPAPVRKLRSVGGDADEMVANFDVSLSAGMFKRAALLLRRLRLVLPSNAPDVVNLHNKYIRSLISYMIVNRESSMVWYAQRWFEVDMKFLSVQPDAITYALMLRMTLRMLLGPRRDRTVRRYWQMAKEVNMEEDVLRAPILSESDLGLLSEICSAGYQGSSPVDSELDVELSGPEPALRPKAVTDKYVDDSILPPDEVRAISQKGFGLSSLKEALSLFNESTEIPAPTDLEGTPEEKALAVSRIRQERLESDAVAAAVERWRKESEKLAATGVTSGNEKKLGPLLFEWYEVLLSKLEEELRLGQKASKKTQLTAEENDRCEYAPYLLAIGPQKLAALTLLSTFGSISKSGMDKGIKLNSLITQLGRTVRDEFIIEDMKRSTVETTNNKGREKHLDKLLHSVRSKKSSGGWQRLVEKYRESQTPVEWSNTTEFKIGALLTTILFSTAKVPVKGHDPQTKRPFINHQPAFSHVYQLQRGYNVGYVNVNQEIVERLRREPATDALAKHLPMVCPPQPWSSHREGGFLSQPISAMRFKHDQNQAQYFKTASARGDLSEIYAGLTVLGKTGWIINRAVFDVMLEAWHSGDEIANIAPESPHLVDPVKPETNDKDAIKSYYRAKTLVENKRSSYHSQRCFQNLQLEIARAYLNETFYLPHNLDFRGRAYPLPPYFNQMGADNCRGLLLFSEGRVLGERGLRWLKIHLANVFGFDKASFQEREQFAVDHIEDVRDSAEAGLNGKRWWLKAADPFQCLAACVELTNALKLPDPTQFVSHLPCHQDGSCNGLQHYAALGGDLIGAQQVNLEPGDRPSDIYTAVAEHVKTSIERDAGQGDKVAQALQGKITRKIVKQTVMTNVYGVTFIGATRQVRKQLTSHYPALSESDILQNCAVYIAKAIFTALNLMFSGAHNIQFWLGDCAHRITQSMGPDEIEEIKTRKNSTPAKVPDKLNFRSTVVWTTPLKLPVVQPYRESKSRVIKTSLQSCTIKDNHASDTVSKRKQLQAFPPNFIHSLDATHMMMSAVKCDELGLSFSAVHDSFWTHAGDIDTMNRVLRDSFIRMHSDDIIGRLAAEFETRYSKNLYLARVRPKSDVGKKITAFRKQSPYSGKLQQPYEIVDEYERLQLLASGDPAQQAKGRAMVTAGSIFADSKDVQSALVSVQSLGVAGSESNMKTEVKEEDLTDTVETLDASVVPPGDLEDLHGDFPDVDVQPATSVKKAQAKSVWVWVPMEFLPIPPKGEFDVSRLKNSQYFFS